ncbi:hypothetical protein TNCV_5093861 [Trichonephila clavipes]|nr:hypothetical protein TNCV_5093861 [Trichonephila clavipes]
MRIRLITNLAQLKKTPQKISGKVPYRFVTSPVSRTVVKHLGAPVDWGPRIKTIVLSGTAVGEREYGMLARFDRVNVFWKRVSRPRGERCWIAREAVTGKRKSLVLGSAEERGLFLDERERKPVRHETGGEGNILQPPALVVSAVTANETFGATDLTSTNSVCTRRVFGGIGHRTQAFQSRVRCSNPYATYGVGVGRPIDTS